jgi:hypothetical protein
MRGKYTAIDKEILIKAYENNGRSMRATGKALGTSEKTIMRRMKEYDYEWDKKVFYSCNDNFFDELNEKSLYWLGFLATDGNVYKHNYSYTINLKLSQKDREHLLKFKSDLNFEGPIHDSVSHKSMNNKKSKDYFGSQITVTSEKIFNRLAEFNIVPAKTHIYRFPELLKNHPDVRHFIRGCIDGDGWIRKHKNNGSKEYNEIRIGMCGTENFVRETFEIIKKQAGVIGGHLSIKSDKNVTWQFEFSTQQAQKVCDWLYDNSNIYLERKCDVARMFIL